MKKLFFVFFAICLVFISACNRGKENGDKSKTANSVSRQAKNNKNTIDITKAKMSGLENESKPLPSQQWHDGVRKKPCETIEYSLEPGTSRSISFSKLSVSDYSEADCNVVKDQTSRFSTSLDLETVTSESVSLYLWTLEFPSHERPITLISGNTTLTRKSEGRYTVFFTDLSFHDSINLSEDEVIKRIENIGKLKQGLESGKVILTQTMNDFYIITFEFNAEVPSQLNNNGLIRGNFIIKCSSDEKNITEGMYFFGLGPRLGIHLARYSNKGNFVFSGPFKEPSCYE